MDNPLPLSGGRKMLPTREDLEYLPLSFFAQGKRKKKASFTLLKDEFRTTEHAPVASPRTCEPGPGELTFVQTDGTTQILAGELLFTAQSTPAWGDQGFYGPAQTRTAGLALVNTIALTDWRACGVGWHTAAAVADPDAMEHAFQTAYTDSALQTEAGTTLAEDLAPVTEYTITLVLRAAGCFYLLDGTLLWVEDAGATAALYPSFSNYDSYGTEDNLLVTDLVKRGYKAWGTEFGIAAAVLSSPSVDETAEHASDFLTYMRDITLPSAGEIEFEFRG